MPTKSPPGGTGTVPVIASAFYAQTTAINAGLWDQYAPYQLMIVECIGPNSYKKTGWTFTLPIPPQDLSIDLPVATMVQATLDGVSIRHGGAPFRNITLQGTTGIAPARNRADDLKQTSVVDAVFAGTVQALNNLNTSVAAMEGRRADHPNLQTGLGDSATDPDTLLKTSTGYYQMRLMERFIESYIHLKTGNVEAGHELLKGSGSAKYRLAFCCWKDEAVYLVEPMQFQKRRASDKPMEYTFSLVLKAWKRINNIEGVQGINLAGPHETTRRDPNKLAAIFNRFRAARDVIIDGEDVLKAALNDPADVAMEALRETALFLAALSGATQAIYLYPPSVVEECVTSVISDWNIIRASLPTDQTLSPELDIALRNGQTLTDELRKEFDSTVGRSMSTEGLRLPESSRQKIIDEENRVRNFTRADFEASRDLVIQMSNDFADLIGAGNATYSETYGRAEPTSTRTPTGADFDILFALNENATMLDHLAATRHIDPPVPTSLEYVAGLAEGSGIAFQIPVSKFAVPFPYGVTLERLAAQYLGDANRWHEIATLNGLRAPYIDETGFELPLLVNGDRRTVMVSDAINLFPGQSVYVSSNVIRREKRHILEIKTYTNGQVVLTLDGDEDLERFTTMAEAVLEAFLPATVNSQQIIYIPSQNEAQEDPRTKAVPGVDSFDPLLKVGGIDLLLTPDGDLALTPDGDCRLAYGLANIVQTVRIGLATPKGALLQHPEYGIDLPVGGSTADVDAQGVLEQLKKMFAEDSMFSGVRSASVTKNGAALILTVEVGVAGTTQFIPISVRVE